MASKPSPLSSSTASSTSASRLERVALIYPPTGLYMRDDRCQAPVEGMTAQPNRTPLDLGYMAAMLEATGRRPFVRDCAAEGASWDALKKDFVAYAPELLLVSVTTPTLERDLIACRIAKEVSPTILTVAKGAHFTAKDDEVLERHPELDVVIRGESEHAIVEIADRPDCEGVLGVSFRRGGQVVRNPDRPFIDVENLDRLPFPARHLLKNALYLTPDTAEPITLINTGRGCPHQCIYCAVTIASGARLKVRSPQNIVEELAECVSRHQIRNFFFRADTFTWNEAWVVELCEQIVSRRLEIRWGCNSRVDTLSEKRLAAMKRAGCWVVGFGIESGNQQMLDLMKKRATLADAERAIALCKRHGLKTYGLFILGLPWETRKTALETIAFAKKLDPDFVDFNIAYPLPGTEYYRIAKEQGLFDDGQLAQGDYARPVVKSLHLTTAELVALRRRALLGFYLRPRYALKAARGIRSPKVLANYLRAGARLLRQAAFAEPDA